MAQKYFTKSTFEFLTALALSNTRSWFRAHSADYEALVREPALELVRDFAPRLRKLSKHLRAVDRKVGGSLIRVQRDVRFSSDKSPYKTNIGIQFRHAVGKDVHAPGLYIHLAPNGCFLGSGVWHPDAPSLRRIRQRIVDNPRAWMRATQAPAFRGVFELDGETLTRPPRGIDPSHPLIEDLKRTDHIATGPLSAKEATSVRLLDVLDKRFTASRAYLGFLCDALGVPF